MSARTERNTHPISLRQKTRPALLGALHESLVGPLAPDNLDDQGRLRDAVQTVTLLALRAVGVMDARARGLVVQAVLPAKTLVGCLRLRAHSVSEYREFYFAWGCFRDFL